MKKNLSLKILALVAAILLWLQQSLLKEHTAEISFPLKFENVPKNYVILANNLSDIPVLVKSRGMNIIFLKKSNCFFRINAANFHFGENKINLGKDDLIFSSKKKIEIIEIKKKSFKIYLDKIITKSVPIKIVFATSKDEEFFLKNKIVNINQNVKIKGPATILSKVKRVKTTAISRKMLKNDKIIADLISPDSKVQLLKKKITLNVTQLRIISKTISLIPVRYSLKENISIIPQKVSAMVQGPENIVKKLNNRNIIASIKTEKIKKNDFVTVDFNLPAGVKLLEYTPQKIQIIRNKK